MKSLLLVVALAPWTIFRLPDTGQTRRYASNPGDDSQYSIHPPRFSIAEGAVTDLVTGLLWQQSDGGEMKWEDAVTYCRDLRLGGADGWRLPLAAELYTIQNHGAINPALDVTVFTRTTAEYWWASEKRADNPALAWAANAGGGIGAHPVTETVSAGGGRRFHARCVRVSATGSGLPELFTDHGDGTVSDNRTGLMWQRSEAPGPLNWEDALAAVRAMSLAGYSDWRLPNIKELRSLHSDSVVRPSVDRRYFPDVAQAPYWSSTTQIGQNGITAWTLDFAFGVVSYNPKVDRLRFRAVRGGSGPRIFFDGARNGASLRPGPVSAGQLLAVFGEGVETASRVRVDGLEAEIVARAEQRLTVLVPDTISGLDTVTLAIESDEGVSPAHVLPFAAASPGLFTADSSGSGPVSARNSDGSANSAETPAARGSSVILYATGLGGGGLPVTVTIGGVPAEVQRVSPGSGGVWEVEARVPEAAAVGPAVALELSAGGFAAQNDITVSIE